jgi:putative phosphoribosyl transferase
MYFKSRAEAGKILAEELAQYRYENCIIVALNDGGVDVGRQIAARLHCSLTMLLTEQIELPGEQIDIGSVNQSGRFTYSGMFSAGEIEEYYDEFHGYIDDQKRESMGRINKLLGYGGIVREDLVREHVVIVVSDGLINGASLDAAADFFKPLHILRLIIVTPVASVDAVDRMHILGDELHVLGVTDNFLGSNHYYDENNVLSHEEIIKSLDDNILSWT